MVRKQDLRIGRKLGHAVCNIGHRIYVVGGVDKKGVVVKESE